jgi:hypothetical protein
LWKILKEIIGKDLTRVSLPVYFNEPLSMTQRVVESNEYCDILLEKASYEADSLVRLAYVTTFMMSRYCTAVDRLQKPFNPLLGETYELVTNKFRLLTE